MPRGEAEQDRLGQLLIQIEELIDSYNEKQDKLLKEQLKIEKCIDKLEESIDRNIMRLRLFRRLYMGKNVCIIKLQLEWYTKKKKY